MRICKKHNFFARKISPMLLSKALMIHMCQNKSWRKIAQEYQVSHIALYQFYEHAKENTYITEIFHVFLECHSVLYIANYKSISLNDLENNHELLSLTQEEFLRIIERL